MKTVVQLTEQNIKAIQFALSWNRDDDHPKDKEEIAKARRKWNKIVKECVDGELCEIITTDDSERR